MQKPLRSTILIVVLALFQPSSAKPKGGNGRFDLSDTSLLFQQQVFTNGPGRGSVTVQRLSGTGGSEQTDRCGRQTIQIVMGLMYI